MPVLDGINACLQIKKGKINYKTPVIAVTAHVLSGEKEQFLQLGMDDCLAKPIDEIALQKMINKWTPNAKVMDGKSLQPRLAPRVKFTQKNLSIDWPLALQQSAGKEELAKELLGMLLTEFVEIKIEVNKALHCDINTLHFAQIIHKFHGGCSYSGVPKLKKVTGLIENELKRGITLELLEPELLELLDELENVAQQAKKHLA